MENKLDSYQNLLNQLQQIKEATGGVPRETALDSEGLGYIGRPIEEMEPSQEPINEEPVGTEPSIEGAVAPINTPIDTAPEAPNNTPKAPPAQEPPDIGIVPPPVKPSEDKYSKLMEQYLAAKDRYKTDVAAGFEADRNSQMMQGIVQNLGKALTYSGFAGGDVMSGPIPLEFKTVNPGYAEQAKEVGKGELDTYKELMDAVKVAKAKGLTSTLQDFGDSKRLITYDADGNIVKDQVVGIKQLSLKDKEVGKRAETAEAGKQSRHSESLGVRKDTLVLNKDKFDWNKIQKDELSDKQIEHITELNDSLYKLDAIDAQGNFFTGPLQGRIALIQSTVGNNPAEKAKIVANLAQMHAQVLKAMSGLVVSEPELKRTKAYLPTMEDSAEQFATKLANYKNKLEETRALTLDMIAKGGKNVAPIAKREDIKTLTSKYATPKPYNSAQESAVSHIMNAKGMDRDTAIQFLQEKKPGQF